MARYAFHIGMGKTGTTSIQHALQAQASELSGAGVQYLGLQFAPFAKVPPFSELWRRPDHAKRDVAKRLVQHMERAAERHGIERYVLSNEAIFAQVGLIPFFEEVAAQADVTIVASFRSAHSWLRSAYAQWGLRHKGTAGRIQPFQERAEELLNHYSAAPQWLEAFGDRMLILDYDRHDDITAAFFEALELPVRPSAPTRRLERPGDVELLFRAAFNDMRPEPTLPVVFDEAVGREPFREPGSVGERMERLLSEDGLDDVLARAEPMLRDVSERTGVNLLAPARPPRPVDHGGLERQVVHALVRATMEQAQRIRELEERIRELGERVQSLRARKAEEEKVDPRATPSGLPDGSG